MIYDKLLRDPAPQIVVFIELLKTISFFLKTLRRHFGQPYYQAIFLNAATDSDSYFHLLEYLFGALIIQALEKHINVQEDKVVFK